MELLGSPEAPLWQPLPVVVTVSGPALSYSNSVISKTGVSTLLRFTVLAAVAPGPRASPDGILSYPAVHAV